MTITSSGVACDVCGQYIIMEDYLSFGVRGCKTELHCHKDCKSVIEAAIDDWHKLPAGPLRHMYDVAFKELEE